MCGLRQSGCEQHTSSSTCSPISVCGGHTGAALLCCLTSMSVTVSPPPPSLPLPAVPSHIFGAKDRHCSLHQYENINFSPAPNPNAAVCVCSLASPQQDLCLSNVLVSGRPRQRSASSTRQMTRVDGLNSGKCIRIKLPTGTFS